MDGTRLLGRIWRHGPTADLAERRAYGFLRLADLLRTDAQKLSQVIASAYAYVEATPPQTDHAASWLRGDHPIQLAAASCN